MDLVTLQVDARYTVSPQLTSDDYPDTDLNRNLNRWYRRIASWIIPVQGEWELRGDILTIDFLAAKTDYEVPQKFFRIYKAEAMYDTDGGFVPITFISVQANQALTEGNSSRSWDDPGAPTAELFGDFMQIKPAPVNDVVNGLKLWAQIDFEDLVDPHDVPDFLEPVHRALAVGGAMDYCKAEEMWTKYRELKKELLGDASIPNDFGLKGEIEALYSIRSGARRDRLVSRRGNFK